MNILQQAAAPADVSARPRRDAWRCRCSTRWRRASPRVAAAHGAPVRLGYVYTPNGIIGACDKSPRPFMWTPKTVGANFEFSPTMKALEPFREQHQRVQRPGAGDRAGARRRSRRPRARDRHVPHRRRIRYKTGGADFQLGISADQIAAKELGKYTQLSSLELGLEPQPLAGNCDSGYTCAYMSMSWRWADQPAAGRNQPAHRRSSGCSATATAPTRPSRMARLEHQKSVLDYVTGSLSRLRMRVGTGDKRKLEEYLEAVRDIERRIQLRRRAERARCSCRSIERPSAVPDDYVQYTKLMIDMQVVAWQTDMTRVCVVHARPRRQQPRLSRDRHLRRTPLHLAPSGRCRRRSRS